MNNENNVLPDNPSITVLKASQSGIFTNYIYKAIPLAFDESMSYYETLLGLLNYLKNVVIPTVNNNAKAVAELQNLYIELHDYVEHYFDNLDLQQEVNNKLDEMVEDGTLERLINTSAIKYNIFNEYQINPTHVIDLPNIDGYYVQGFCFDGSNYYVGYLDTATYNAGIIVKYNLLGEEIARSTQTFGHVNNIELINDELWIGSLENIIIVNKSTLAQSETITIRDSAIWVVNMPFSVNYGGINVNQANQYCLNDKNEMIVLYDKKIIDTIPLPSTPLTQQGATAYNGVIFNVESVGPDIGLKNIVTMYNVQGQVLGKINTNLTGELEDITILNNTLYLFGSIGENSTPAIYSCNIANLIPWRTYSLIYNAKGQRYKATLEKSGTQLTKITVPPIVDIYLAYGQPVNCEIIDNHQLSVFKYLASGGFYISQTEFAIDRMWLLTYKFTRNNTTGTYDLASFTAYDLTNGTSTTSWNQYWGGISNIFFTLGQLSR